MNFRCNFCHTHNSVPTVHDPNQDGYCPELTTLPLKYGTIEYEVGGEYITRTLDPSAFPSHYSSQQQDQQPTTNEDNNNNDNHSSSLFKENNLISSNPISSITNLPALVHLYALDASDHSKLLVYIDAIQALATEMARAYHRHNQHHRHQHQQHQSSSESNQHLPAPRIGFLAYVQDHILIPHIPCKYQKQSQYQQDITPMVSIMTDVVHDPFCPLPLEQWTYDVSTFLDITQELKSHDLPQQSQSQFQSNDPNPNTNTNPNPNPNPNPNHPFYQLIQSLPNLISKILPHTDPRYQKENIPPSHRHKLRWNSGGAAMAVIADALSSSPLSAGGGRGTLLTSSRPNHGVGAISDRQAGGGTTATMGGSSGIRPKCYDKEDTMWKLCSPLQRNKDLINKSIRSGFGGQGSSMDYGGKNQKDTPTLMDRTSSTTDRIIMDTNAAIFYDSLEKKCHSNNISFDIVISTPLTNDFGTGAMGARYLDVATLGELCRVTCGRLSWLKVDDGDILMNDNGGHGSFQMEGSYGQQVRQELLRSTIPFSGNDAVFKLRCSNGVRIKAYQPKNRSSGVLMDNVLSDSPEIELSNVTPGTTLTIELEHRVGGVRVEVDYDGNKNSNSDPMVYFQSALLYTNQQGRRRVRVSTLALPTTTSPAETFACTDIGALATFITRASISEAYTNGLKDTRATLVERYCSDLLVDYRLHTSAKNSPSNQLIIPESVALLPLFVFSLKKGLMLGRCLGNDATNTTIPFPSIDERTYRLLHGINCHPSTALLCVRPIIYDISGMTSTTGEFANFKEKNQISYSDPQVSEGGEDFIKLANLPYIELPQSLHCSVGNLRDNGIYIVDDGIKFYLLIGENVRLGLRTSVITMDNSANTFLNDHGLPSSSHKTLTLNTSSELGQRIWRIIYSLRIQSCPMMSASAGFSRPTNAPLVVVIRRGGEGHRAGVDNLLEESIIDNLVDDSSSKDDGLIDFLCQMHRNIRDRVDIGTRHNGF